MKPMKMDIWEEQFKKPFQIFIEEENPLTHISF